MTKSKTVVSIIVMAFNCLMVELGMAQEIHYSPKDSLQKEPSSRSPVKKRVSLFPRESGMVAAEVNIFIFKVKSETVATTPSDRSRTQIGIGEEVTCSIIPASIPASLTANWSENTGNGKVSPAMGTSTTFTASQSPSTSRVRVRVGGVECTLNFTVIAPNGILYSPDNADSPDYPRIPGPPNLFIGNGRYFPVTIQPTTVSFCNVEFRENKPGNNITWPDGTNDNGVSAGQPPFRVLQNNGGVSDHISGPLRPYNRLYNGSNYVTFTFAINVPLEYKNNLGAWTEFMSGIRNNHARFYTATGACALRAVGNNIQNSAYRGPWQN